MTQSYATFANSNCFQVLQKKNLTKKIPQPPSNDGSYEYN